MLGHLGYAVYDNIQHYDYRIYAGSYTIIWFKDNDYPTETRRNQKIQYIQINSIANDWRAYGLSRTSFGARSGFLGAFMGLIFVVVILLHAAGIFIACVACLNAFDIAFPHHD